jgi:hypothetical protein
VTIRLGIPRSKNQWFALVLALFAGGGSALPLARGFLSLAWPKVNGVVTHSRNAPGSRTIGVDIGYRYTADGRSYEGDRYRFQALTTGVRMRGRDVDMILGRYRVGEPVKVSVNPSDPTDSVLEAGPDAESVIPLILGLILLRFALAKSVELDPPREVSRPRNLLGKILAASGIALIVLGAVQIYRGMSSTLWPAVQGKILYSHVRSRPNPETLLWYEYYVGEQRYLASDYRQGGNVTPFQSTAEAAAKRYPAGRVVSVYYNPANPRQALLEPGLWWGNFVAPSLGLLLLGAGWIAKRYADIMAGRYAASPRSFGAPAP